MRSNNSPILAVGANSIKLDLSKNNAKLFVVFMVIYFAHKFMMFYLKHHLKIILLMESNHRFIGLIFLGLAMTSVKAGSVIPPEAQVRIPFAAHEAELSVSGKKTLIMFLQAHPISPTTLIRITGHTDLFEQDNTLSLERASTIKNFLVTNGLIPDNIFTEGVGDAHPFASNATNDGRFLNRCADIHLEYIAP